MMICTAESQGPATRALSILEYDAGAFARDLIVHGALAQPDWELALEISRQGATSPLQAMLDLGQISEPSLADRLASWFTLPRWESDTETASRSGLAPVEFMRRAGALLLDDDAGVRLVLSDPSDRFTLDALRRCAPNASIEIGSHKEIEAFLDAEESALEAPLEDDSTSAPRIDVSRELSALRDLASEAPVVRFWNQTLERAIDLGASDIHIERFDRRAMLRFRIDGALIDQPVPALELVEPLLCRIKIMAGLDIAERRRAQDGRLRVRLRGRAVDLRISLVPTIHGQDAVLRIQDRQRLVAISLDDLGFERSQTDLLRRAALSNHGIVLITGPTGSGKTTTLYALLKTLVSTQRKLVTVEDPVEFAMDGVNQIQLNPAVELSFSTTLRHILRHDPDVILVGEIRDAETAQIAFQASLTGHLVLSTLHTNDVPGTFVRLVDMGVEPYLVGAAVELVTAQRLVRVLCVECAGVAEQCDRCRVCRGLGYRGRVAIMETSGLTAGARKVLIETSDEQRLCEALLVDGYQPMIDGARALVQRGVTDEAEIIRVLGVSSMGGQA